MNASDFFKNNCLKNFVLASISLFTCYCAYGASLQETKSLQDDQEKVCITNLLKNKPVQQLSLYDQALLDHQYVHSRPSYFTQLVKYLLKKVTFSAISLSSISHLTISELAYMKIKLNIIWFLKI